MTEVLPTATQPSASYSTRVKENVKERLDTFKSGFRLGEISGSLGDLGTLLPILLSLSLTGQVDLTASLIFGGVWNIVTGFVFRMPMCVQPMKSIAAIALTNKMSMGSVMGAGMSVSAIIMFLGITRTIYIVKKYTPIAVIRGIQLGTAVSFGGKAAELVLKAQSFGGEGWDWANNYEWACLSFIIVFLFYYRAKRIPTAIIIFFLGLIIAFIKLYTNPPAKVVYPKIGIYTISTIVPTPEEFKHGFLSAGLGGLAAQYRFGARSEVSIILLGILKIFFGLFFGSSLSGLIQCFPSAILGVMLFVSGIELGAVARTVNDGVYDDQKRHANFIVMITTAGMLVGFKNDGIGFLGGMVGAGCFYLAARYGGSMDEDNTGVMTQQQHQDGAHAGATTQDSLPVSRGSDDDDQDHSSIRKVSVQAEQPARS
ncbi:hypothetical protein BGX24_003903 [Mortierella sp. AD032]|nr:hypothetical protein BGX24_003903 [Mortierella sp. AD032]